MLSPATFIGIAKAIAPTGPTPPVQPVPPSRAQPAGNAPIQRARIPATSSIVQDATPPGGAKPPAATSSGPQATPPRNLPRGSLLDLSV